MSTLFRVEALELDTENSRNDRRPFSKGLNLLIGDPGSGKSTLIELMKFALGMGFQRTPVMRSVHRVTLEVAIGKHLLSLSRSMVTPGTVKVVDLRTGEAVGEFPVSPSEGQIGIGTALLTWLEIPADIEVTVHGRRRTVTFEHVWEYMHVPQLEIDHSIARHDAPSLKAQRKRVFELLFGLVDERLIALENALTQAKEKGKQINIQIQGANALTERIGLPSREELESELSGAEERRRRLAQVDGRLRSSLGTHDDRIVAVRGLLSTTRTTLVRTDEALERLEETQHQRRTHSEGLLAALDRLARTRTANTLLTPIEFDQCPRCLQMLDEHRADPGTCLLCLQDISEETPSRSRKRPRGHDSDPEQLPLVIPEADGPQENQLSDQIDEIRQLLEQGERERESLLQYRTNVVEGLRELEEELGVLTSGLGFPGSEELARVAEQLARAEAEVERAGSRLATLDHTAAFTSEADVAREAVREAKVALEVHEEYLESTSDTLFAGLTEVYDRLLRDFAAPNVRVAEISSSDYLPYIDEQRFDSVNISGGNRVPFIVGYWLALHSTALSNPHYFLPGFLILDSPQKSLGPRQELSSRMYRQIRAMSTARKENLQVFVLDTNLPDGFTQDGELVELTYASPGIRSITHPGPNVRTVEGERAEEEGTD